jgi:hypothetical protein
MADAPTRTPGRRSGYGRGVESFDVDFVVRVAIGLFVITAPVDPIKLLFFDQTVSFSGQSRTGAAVKLSRTFFA